MAGNRIREWRERRGLSQIELAEKVNTSSQQIGKLEAGARRLAQNWMERLAEALGCAPADLLPGGAGPDSDGTYRFAGTPIPPADDAAGAPTLLTGQETVLLAAFHALRPDQRMAVLPRLLTALARARAVTQAPRPLPKRGSSSSRAAL